MKECIICLSIRRDINEQISEIYFITYPLILLKKAYECDCINSYAHNICLKNINKCPTCRKNVTKPNLYVETKFDYYFFWIFNFIKKNPLIIIKFNICCFIFLFLLLILLLLIEKNIILLSDNSKSNIVICILFFIILFSNFMIVIDEYLKKYWLYNNKTQTIES